MAGSLLSLHDWGLPAKALAKAGGDGGSRSELKYQRQDRAAQQIRTTVGETTRSGSICLKGKWWRWRDVDTFL